MSDATTASAWGASVESPTPKFVEALETFRDALQKTYASAEDERQIAEAYEDYAAALQEPWQDEILTRNVNELHAAFTERVHAAFDGDNRRSTVEAAFADYVAAVKSVWQDLDPATVEAEDLLAISQSIGWVGSVMSAIGPDR